MEPNGKGSDPLQSLVADEREFARETLAEALRPLLNLTKDGDLLLKPNFSDLKARQQVLAILLGLKAAELLEFRSSPAAPPGEIVEVSGMAAGTVRPALSSLLKERLVSKDDSGAYFIPLHAAGQVIEIVKR